jgi:hypothetical protein
MAQQFPALTDPLVTFIEQQHIFFTGSAAREGRVNISPKGSDCLKILSHNTLVWQNLTGSGNETAAHIRDNNRMTLMFCSFEKKPLILRIYGIARAVHPRDGEWKEYRAMFPDNTGTRQFYVVDIDLVQTSCGFAVPFMDFVSDRDALDVWAQKHGEEGIRQYWQDKNQLSIDGFDTGIFE